MRFRNLQTWALPLVGMIVCGQGCSEDPVEKYPYLASGSVADVHYTRRNLSTGDFEMFLIQDEADVARLISAIRGTLTRPDPHEAELDMSMNHVLALRRKDGLVFGRFAILGDEYLATDNQRYLGKLLVSTIKEIEQDGGLQPVGSEEEGDPLDIYRRLE